MAAEEMLEQSLFSLGTSDVLAILFITIFVFVLAVKYIQKKLKNRKTETRTVSAAPAGISADLIAAITSAVCAYRKNESR